MRRFPPRPDRSRSDNRDQYRDKDQRSYGRQNSGSPPRPRLVQDPFLNVLRKEEVSADIYLVNGIKLVGRIQSFDQNVVIINRSDVDDGRMTDMVYKQALSTITPHYPMLRGPDGMTTSEDAVSQRVEDDGDDGDDGDDSDEGDYDDEDDEEESGEGW